MRKVCAILLTVLLLFTGYAKGEEVSAKFRGIEWGIEPMEFDQALKEQGIVFEKKDSPVEKDYWVRFEGAEGIDKHTWGVPQQSYYYESPNDGPVAEVAGYKSSRIIATFRASYSIEDLTIGNPYTLARAEYLIYGYDFPEELTGVDVFEDLLGKLISLYGDPKGSEKSEKLSDSFIRKAWWHIADGTGVSLELSYHEYMRTNIVTIEYGIVDEADYLNGLAEFYEMQKENTLNEGKDNKDGL